MPEENFFMPVSPRFYKGMEVDSMEQGSDFSKDSLLLAVERAIALAKKHIEMLERAIQESEYHTADLACGVVIQNVMFVRSALDKILKK